MRRFPTNQLEGKDIMAAHARLTAADIPRTVNPFTQQTWNDERDAQAPVTDRYTQLAHDARRGRSHLRADQLLPGDVVKLDGEHWQLADMKVKPGVVRLVLVPCRWEPEVQRHDMIEVVSQVPRFAPTRRRRS